MTNRYIRSKALLFVCITLITGARAQLSTSITYEYAKISFPGATLTIANGINNSNMIVGSYFDSKDVVHGFLYRRGKFTTVDFPGATVTEVFGINDEGDIVGLYQLPGRLNSHGFLRRNGAFTTIDSPQAQFGTSALAINRAGTIVGSYDDAHGFVYRGGAYQTLDAPQLQGEAASTQLNGISNLGWIAGQVLSGGNWRGFWIAGGHFHFLEPMGSSDNQIMAINGQGDIVGCHDAMAGFVSFHVGNLPGGQGSQYPVQERLASCATAITFARAVVGNYFTVKQPYGFLGVPALTLEVADPITHSIQTNPVHLLANASGINPISHIEVWANFKKVFQVKGAVLDTKLTLPLGTNVRLVIKAVDSKGVTAKLLDPISIQ